MSSPLLTEAPRIVERTGALEVPHKVDAMAAILTGALLTLVHILLTRGSCQPTNITHPLNVQLALFVLVFCAKNDLYVVAFLSSLEYSCR